MRASFHAAIGDIDAATWDGLFGAGHPFTSHAFLHALEASGCVAPETGWAPCHLLVEADGAPLAAMPLYRKSHSYGEFVFDWGWAEAYARHGLAYYPKLLTAVPFTPVPGPRIGLAAGADPRAAVSAVVEAVRALARREGMSGWHLLFPRAELGDALRREPHLMRRRDVRFHWFNRGYADFDDFLATLRSSKRKGIRRERRAIAEQGLVMQRLVGAQITAEDWAGFGACYRDTYRKRSGHEGYLDEDFFGRLAATLGERLMLAVARRDGRLVASALFAFDDRALYGRYWGALEDIRFGHFEACLYQGIDFCIERGLAEFDPGTQGEHKLVRGFEPVETVSHHWIADERFREAIDRFTQAERRGVARYRERAAAALPFRRDR